MYAEEGNVWSGIKRGEMGCQRNGDVGEARMLGMSYESKLNEGVVGRVKTFLGWRVTGRETVRSLGSMSQELRSVSFRAQRQGSPYSMALSAQGMRVQPAPPNQSHPTYAGGTADVANY
ncbi:hypothetical protein BJV78DRAFT_1156446 [Lactifluus subvellereus]|nr:hypothetical protein BJV78DRAFT_1156446 [Lactifluus subvellereus]